MVVIAVVVVVTTVVTTIITTTTTTTISFTTVSMRHYLFVCVVSVRAPLSVAVKLAPMHRWRAVDLASPSTTFA